MSGSELETTAGHPAETVAETAHDAVVDAELVDDPPAPTRLPAAREAAPAVVEVVDINDTLTPEAAQDLASTGRPNTRETYRTRWKMFAQWCAENGRHPGPPTTSKNLASYIAHLRRQDAPPGTLRMAIAAVRSWNARAGHEQTPDTAPALTIYQDHRYAWAAAGRGQRSSAPVDLERLAQMLAVCPAGTLTGRRDRVLLLLGYHIRARASELTALRVGDLEFVSGELVVVTKRISKNDRNDAGREYEIDDPACLAALRAWLHDLEERGQDARHLPLLRSVDQWDNLRPVSARTGLGLTRQAVNTIVKARAHEAGVDVADAITAHGLRAGVPTDLGAAGYTAGEIKDITGDWASTEMVERYRKVGLRRAGRRTDSGRRAAALSMLRLPPLQDEAGDA
ncbi:tyrosine-type recombinase/integrase [Streptomyces sp. MJP52]|uniref:tyrosine-type recombinase/integrase n=1 Tax=Streptomyces sp. MJP52 TaxID=2940555 RepID=UPI0024737AC3|nr:tyrosine-type recombinase/integrase [Streptomyces sp. MJP52]MDH6229136.1 site-specific recombinase XerD [Streptomyces sp. MJP52]